MSRYDQIPWIEKYRPSKLEDIILDEHIYKKIKKIIDDKEMPNLILPGVPGIGKTTTIKCIIRALYSHYSNDAVLELNASDDRGIKAVKEKIESFCKKQITFNDNPDKTPIYCTHKIIFLDEADNMTNKAQRLINNLMEKYHKTTRFAFTCNSSSDIIEGIQSRCIIMRFYRLQKDQIIKRLEQICKLEDITIKFKPLKTIAEIADGDLRCAINNLQLVYRSCDKITVENIYRVCSKPQPEILKNIIKCCIDKEFLPAKNLIFGFKKNGYSESDIVLGLIQLLKSDYEINEDLRIKFMDKLCYYAYIISKGLASDLQLMACIIELID